MTFIQIIHIYATFPARFAFLHKKEQMKKSSVLDKEVICYYTFSPNSEYSIEALMKSLNRGCALFGLDLNSGWN